MQVRLFGELEALAAGVPVPVRGAAGRVHLCRSFFDAERTRLDELTLVAAESRAEADLGLGRHGEVAGELEARCRDHPLRERLWELLVLALYRSGRQAEALRAYTEVRDHLAGELGLDPGPALRELQACRRGCSTSGPARCRTCTGGRARGTSGTASRPWPSATRWPPGISARRRT